MDDPIAHETFENFWFRRSEWQLRFAWFPHRCEKSRKIIWLARAYCGTLRLKPDGPTSVFRGVTEKFWLTPQEFVFWSLKNV